MKKQIRKLLHRFENLKFRKKLSVLMLIAGLVPVVFLAFSMQYGMTNQLREKEQYNLEKILEQSVNSIENQSQIYENLVDYLSYSQSLRNIFDTEMESDYEKYLKYVKVADPFLHSVWNTTVDSPLLTLEEVYLHVALLYCQNTA